jgi:hypothetical protein
MIDGPARPPNAAARDLIVRHLLEDATVHEAGREDAIGRRFDAVARQLMRGEAAELARLRIALVFWDGWIDARNGGWQTSTGISRAEWPALAREIAADLANERDIANPRVLARFDATTGSLSGRAQGLSDRLRLALRDIP